MPDEPETELIRSQAEKLLRGGNIAGGVARKSGRVEDPVAVRVLDGSFHSWFVPVTVKSQIAGFFQFLPDGTLMRFSSFQRRSGEIAGCPAASDWLDVDRIRARGEVQRRPDETSGRPFLTFDRTPDRLVWAVPFKNSRGQVRFVYVVGNTVYTPPPEETYG